MTQNYTQVNHKQIYCYSLKHFIYYIVSFQAGSETEITHF